MIINLTIDRFEGDQAVLTGLNGQNIVWPKNQLPGNLQEGASLVLEITESKERTEKICQTAKEIINEIINQP